MLTETAIISNFNFNVQNISINHIKIIILDACQNIQTDEACHFVSSFQSFAIHLKLKKGIKETMYLEKHYKQKKKKKICF